MTYMLPKKNQQLIITLVHLLIGSLFTDELLAGFVNAD